MLTNSLSTTGHVTKPPLSVWSLPIETMETFDARVIWHKTKALWFIPVHDEMGKRIGSIARDPISSQDMYHGGFERDSVVFNLNRVISFGRGGILTVTEDPYDCVSLWATGERNVVSLLGPKLSNVQFELIFRSMTPSGIRLVLSRTSSAPSSRLQMIEKFATKTYVRVVKAFAESVT